MNELNDVKDLDSLINERKQTSEAYARWQRALELRDQIYREIGSGNSASKRAIELVKFWNAEWQAECAELDPTPSAATLANLLHEEAMMHRVIEERKPKSARSAGGVK